MKFNSLFLVRFWRNLSISRKFRLGYSFMVALIVTLIVASLVTLKTVRVETETAILQSTTIQRNILNMDRGLERARRLETQFFLRYPTLGYTKAYEQYALPAAEQVAQVAATKEQLEALIDDSRMADIWQDNQANFNLYFLAVDRHIVSVEEATQLIAQQATDEIGLISQLLQHENQLLAIVESVADPDLLITFRELQSFANRYLFERQRSLMQSAFNHSAGFKENLGTSQHLAKDQRDQALMILEAYLKVANEILEVDEDILSIFSEFELQSETIDPITTQLIDLANQEIGHAQERIRKVGYITNIAFLLLAVIGLGIAGSIAMALNTSISRNIIELTEVASDIEAGNLDARVHLDSGDELGQLAATFNLMTGRLKILVDDLEQQVAARTAEIEAAQQKLQLAMRAADEGLWEWNLITNEAYFDDVALEMVGYTRKDYHGALTEGSWWMDQVHPDDQKGMSTAFNQYLAGEAAGYAVEFRLKCKDGGYVWVASNGEILSRDKEGQPEVVVGIHRNIEAHKLAEQELARHRDRLEERVAERTRELEATQEKLIRQERLAVLGQLAGSVGHELRNPLAVISNAIYFLEMVIPKEDEKVGEYLEMIDSNVHEATQIVSDLLDFARVKSVDRSAVKVSDLVEVVLSQNHPNENVTLNVNIPNDLHRMHVDRQQIKQVLANLVMNAYQAMSSPSSDETPDGGNLTIAARQQGEKIKISVTDTGAGIAPENQDKIFEPLFTTKSKGVGLGLAICKNLTEANGGSIGFESEIGVGTTFMLTLPFYEAAT